MNRTLLLKAVADETRMKILTLLLKHNCCVRELAKMIGLTEATVSQHLKVLRESGLISGEKRGYFMHYDIEREVLRGLAKELESLADTPREPCAPEAHNCVSAEQEICHSKNCSDQTKAFCHGKEAGNEGGSHHHGSCKCHRA